MLAVVFNIVAGITLFLFAIHYIYYILNALTFHHHHHSMQSEDAKYIKKRLKPGSIEPHPTEKALILNYKLEATVFGEPGDPMLEESKNCQRIIRLKSLSSKSDPYALAKEVVDKCEIIHKSQIREIEQIIYYLKNRSNATIEMNHSTHRSSSRGGGGSGSGKASPSKELSLEKQKEKPSIRNLEEYVELLYEDLPERIRGSALILKLARLPDNLEELEKNESVLSALARVLREDWRKSLELATNIIYIFFCFSTYSRFHHVIINYRIGSLCMVIVDNELRRYDAMKNELGTRSKNSDNKPQPIETTTTATATNNNECIMNEERPKDMELPRRRIPELKQRPKSGNWSNQSFSSMSSSLRSLNNSYHEDLSGAVANVNIFDNNNPATTSTSTSSNNLNELYDIAIKKTQLSKDDFDRINKQFNNTFTVKQFKVFTMKQEQLLRVAFYLLLNIAENVVFEEKMCKRPMVTILIKALERQNVEVLILVVTFLKKLSIVKDNKDEMNQSNIIEHLPKLLQINHPDLIQVTLKFIFNLSFDGNLRAKMIRMGLLSKLVTFLSDDKHHGIVIRILYHMSLDDKVKSMFTYTECIPLATDMLILNLDQKADIELIALCINLALNKRNALLMCENNRLHTLMTRAFKYQDSLLMKMIRNISQHESLRTYFIDFVGDLARVLTECQDDSFMVECLGILGNLSLPDLDYSQILNNFGLIPWVRNILVPGKSADDLVLDTVIFLGTCACDESCAMLLCKADVILSLIELLKAKQEDDEMVLQIIFVFQQILRNESTRDYMIRETESPAYLIDLMHDKNQEIRKVCDYCLDIIAITNSDWASRIKLEKFRSHNAQWLNMVESQQELDNPYYDEYLEDDDNDLPAYLTSEYLNQCMIYQNDDPERLTSAMSNYNSRPMSRYSRDFDDHDAMTSSSKSRLSIPDDAATRKHQQTKDDQELLTEIE